MTAHLVAQQIRTPPDHRRVLVVEDDEDIRESVSAILEDAGYLVDACVNGKDALERLQGSPADAIVLDLMTPVMNGWEFVSAQKEDPAIAQIPVVAISADSSPKARAIRAGTYLPKPFGANELLAAVERVLLDADRRKLTERLDEMERLVVLGTIAAGVGHEINNPLSVVVGSVELIQRTLCAARQSLHAAGGAGKDDGLLAPVEEAFDRMREQLRDCSAGLERIRVIVRDLRSVSRRAGDERTLVDLGLLLDAVIAMTSGEIDRRVELVRAYEPAVQVVGNETRLGQVFLNLLINAAQSIPKDGAGHPQITVGIRKVDERAIVEVRDTGRGMSRAQLERIFEPFFTTKGHAGGTGLGLAICKEIVEGLGGTIEAESELGRGSAFTVALPLVPPPETTPSNAE